MTTTLVVVALAAVLSSLETPPTPAETTTPAAKVEEKITVTAMPIVGETRYEPLAGAVVEVGAQQIEDLSAQDVASALRRVPGLVISRYNPVGSYGGGDGGSVFVRGQGAGRPGAELAMRVDGVAKFVGVWTHPLLDLVGIDAAERLDVYKGPQPVLFGNMAFATVDLVPRRRTEEGFGGRLSAAGGSFGTTAFSLHQSGRVGRLDYAISGGARESDGHREGADGRTRSLLGRIGYELGGGWSLSTTIDVASGRASDPGVAGAASLPVRPRFASDDAMGIVTLARRHGKGDRARDGFVKLWLDDGSIDWQQWDGTLREAFTSLTDWRNYGVKVQDRFAVGERGDLTVGLDVERYGGASREVRPRGEVALGDFLFGNTAVYAGYAHRFGDQVHVVPSLGVRYNDSRDFGGEWGGQAGVKIDGRLGEVWLRAARAFNLPGVWVASFYRGYGRGDQYQDLKPELLDQVELGAAHAFGDTARLEISLFRNEVTDALRFVPPPPPPPRWDNIGSYTARGAEAMFSAQPLSGLSLFLGATWTRTEPAAVPYTPEWSSSAGLTYARGAWRLSLDLQQVSAQETGNLRFPGAPARLDGYLLTNGRVAWQIERTGLELFFAGENLGDVEYAYRSGYSMPGRNLLTGVSWSF